jgi:hypothetical protein
VRVWCNEYHREVGAVLIVGLSNGVSCRCVHVCV